MLTPSLIGWLRLSRQRWQPVCQAESVDECWRLLLAVQVPKCVKCVERTVLVEGRKPQRYRDA